MKKHQRNINNLCSFMCPLCVLCRPVHSNKRSKATVNNVLPHLQRFQDGADIYNILSNWGLFLKVFGIRKLLSFLIIFTF